MYAQVQYTHHFSLTLYSEIRSSRFGKINSLPRTKRWHGESKRLSKAATQDSAWHMRELCVHLYSQTRSSSGDSYTRITFSLEKAAQLVHAMKPKKNQEDRGPYRRTLNLLLPFKRIRRKQDKRSNNPQVISQDGDGRMDGMRGGELKFTVIQWLKQFPFICNGKKIRKSSKVLY